MRLFVAVIIATSLVACSVADIPGTGGNTDGASANQSAASTQATAQADQVCAAGSTKVAPGPIDVVQAIMRRRRIAFA